MNRSEFQHLMNRSAFGCTFEQLQNCESQSRKEVVEALFAEVANPTELTTVKRLDVEDIQRDLKESSGDTKKMFRKMLVDRGRDLNVAWLNKMISGKEQLNEKMTFFWHGHFACRDENPVLLQSLNNAMRANALGKFKDLVMAVGQAPAMLSFLNNQQNRKNAPNENFAREVMELFTLGRGNYTEQDIKEAARAFTGWGFDRQTLEFHFKEQQHDYDEKEFFGQKGNFGGTNIIDMILYKEQCAHHIAGKIYTFFVNDTRDEDIISTLAQKLYMSDYDLAALMKEIYLSDWFYDAKNMGTKIKSPVELIVGASRVLNAGYEDLDKLIFIQRILGQILFLPPNVAGWPGGKRWIDNSSLIFRMDLGRKLIESAEMRERLKPDDDNDPNMMAERGQAQEGKAGKLNTLNAKINWDSLNQHFEGIEDDKLLQAVSSNLLSLPVGKNNQNNFHLKGVTKSEKLKSTVAYVMSMPEYQLC